MTKEVNAAPGGCRDAEITQMRLERAEGRCLPVEEQGIPACDEPAVLANANTMIPGAAARFVAAMERGARLGADNHRPARAPWIEACGGPDCQALCRGRGALTDRTVAGGWARKPWSLPRWTQVQDRFSTATRLETQFWTLAG